MFGVLLAVAMFVPNMPLQMVFAQQTARALATGRERQLAGMIRLAWIGTFILWLLVAVPALIFQNVILERWQIANPVGLWLVLPAILFSLWLPMFSGVMQGQQNFFWLGWQNIINAAGRLGLAAIAVLVFGGYAAGMFTGVCLGLGTAVVVCIWQTRGLWSLPAAPFDRRNLLAQIIPLMLGFGGGAILSLGGHDVCEGVFLRRRNGLLRRGGNIVARAAVAGAAAGGGDVPENCPCEREVGKKQSARNGSARHGDAGGWRRGGTVPVRAARGDAGLFKPDYVAMTMKLLPWYAGAMIPLALANVLVNDFMARGRYRIVPALLLLVGAYAFALTQFHDSFITVLKRARRFQPAIVGNLRAGLLGAKAQIPKS